MAAQAASQRILALDGWRGLAIICVLFGHFFQSPDLSVGRLGVELFFVLSGRLMADILFVKQLELGEFFYRRVTRIVPTLFAFILVVWTTFAIAGPPFAMSPIWLATALTFTENYGEVLIHQTGWLGHLWSLCVEEHSYLLLGLIAYLCGRFTKSSLTVVWIVALFAMADGAFCTWALGGDYWSVYTRSDVHLASIFLSVNVYLLVRHRLDQTHVARWATPAFLATSAAGLALSLAHIPDPIVYTLGTGCFAVAIALADIAAKPILRVLAFPGLTQMGVWSYSIYLWQQPFYKLHEMGIIPGAKIALLGAALAAGIASHYFLERPARRWLNACWGRRRAAQEARNLAGRTPWTGLATLDARPRV